MHKLNPISISFFYKKKVYFFEHYSHLYSQHIRFLSPISTTKKYFSFFYFTSHFYFQLYICSGIYAGNCFGEKIKLNYILREKYNKLYENS